MFVTIEGIEGSGKSTLLAGLAQRLRSAGCDAVVTREPGGTPLGDAVRALFLDPKLSISAVAEAMLVNAARAQHVTGVILPALAAGEIVLCARFIDSTLAYQGYGRGVDLDLLRTVSRAATGGLEPDLVLLLDVPVDVSQQRTRARRPNLDRLEAEDDSFHERVRRGFLELAAESLNHVVLDGTEPAARVLHEALQILGARLGVPVT